MSNEWFARPVLFAADIDRSIDFYVKQLGFSHPWRYEEEKVGSLRLSGRDARSFSPRNGPTRWARASCSSRSMSKC